MLRVCAVISLCVSCLQWGCADVPLNDSGLQDEFHAAAQRLNHAYGGEGKADIATFGDPCILFEPILEWGDQALKSGFFMGAGGEGVLGPAVSTGGYDVVWDLYHGQMTVSQYGGRGLNLAGGVGASVSMYVGWVGGFSEGVSDWDGHHIAVSGEISAPLLKDYAHLKPEAFTSVQDLNQNGRVDPQEIQLTPQGVYGFSIGVSFGVELIPDPLPISAKLVEGKWGPHHHGIKHTYELLKRKRLIPIIGEPLAVTLIDEDTGEVCPEDWPALDEHHECIIQLGQSDWSHTRNALHVAASVCALNQGCLSPISWPQSGLALAIGLWRDRADSGLEGMCEQR